MAETKIYIADEVDAKLRALAMERFGYGRGSISSAVEEAIIQWLNTQHAIKNKIQGIIKIAEKDRHVIAILLFGSYARREKNYRDIDIAILIDNEIKSFDELNKYSTIEDDIKFDISILNDLPLNVQTRVLNEAKIIFLNDKNKLYDYSIQIAEKWSNYSYRLNILSGEGNA
ncbi:MAG: nucleotidyltransferase domain-containing protein [Candidatus Marsarchaeota archaeon]|nr:nucleotidyltransferase domain-containing protein [Candidatus Marsarchaeota archaeon]MCL5094708.1 nucleotidyltransferase domain-containing protein [Candidatus Marsarchaeota archaeon]